MLKRGTNRQKERKTCAIVGDGYCEKIYFDHLKQTESLTIDIHPQLPLGSGKGGMFVRVFKKAEELLSKGYDHVFCLIDMDTVHSENKLQQYSARKSKLEKKGVKILESNPCFEVWFLLHFNYTTKSFDSCDAVTRELRKHPVLNDYAKSQEYQSRKNLYSLLKERLCKHAIPNAKKLESERDGQSVNCPRCQIFKLIETFQVCNKNGK